MLDVFLNDTPMSHLTVPDGLTSAYAAAFACTQLHVPFNRTVEIERKTKTWREHMVFHHLFLEMLPPIFSCYDCVASP